MKTLYLVDASAMFFRAFYAIRNLTAPSGMPVNAVYGYMSMTAKLLKDIKPDYMAYCYDPKEGSFRNEMDSNYKANRSEMPEDMVPQIPYMKILTEHLGICSLEKKGFEADDVIGTLACQARDKGIKVVIVSGDKDFGQLIGPHVTMYDTMRDIRYDVDKVREKWGVLPEQFIDYLAIVGDTSDNIPGIKGIGPKGAATLLTEYGSLDGIYENLSKIKSKATVKKLEEGRESAYHAQKLVTIKTDVELDLKVEELALKSINEGELRSIFHELNFRNFERSLLGGVTTPEDEEEASKANSEKAGAEKPAGPEVEFKVEESFETPKEITLNFEGLQKWLSPEDKIWAHSTDRALLLAKGGELAVVDFPPDQLGPLLSRRRLRWEGHDLKSLWRHYNVVNPEQPEWDSQLASYVVRAGDKGGFEKVFFECTGETLPQLAQAPLVYAAHQKLKSHLAYKLKEVGGESVYKDIELPLSPILLGMEQRGVRLNVPMLAKESVELEKDIQSIQKEIFEAAGEEFNVGSPKQLAAILFEKLKLPTGKKTKTGFSTDNDVLVKLSTDYKIAQMIVDYRELAKLKSTYVDALPALVNPMTGRLHSCFNQALTTTGRLSSTNPNLQNIPIRTERGSRIREAFITEPGYALLSADYSQIELRILAHITQDEGLCQAFEKDSDIHRATAAEIFSLSPEKVSAEDRRKAKAVNFGIAYGQGAFGLAESLRISRSEAKEIIERYFTRFSRVKEYMDNTIEQATKDGYVTTLFGRRRYLPELQGKSGMRRKFGERAAINAPIQGSAADIIKLAMIKASEAVDLRMLLQVHDELIMEGPQDKAEAELPKLIDAMESAALLSVPLKVNGALGESWGEAH